MRILLGAIVTNMAGSIGGQSVRRYRGGFVMQNKAHYTANNLAYQNQRIAIASQLFRSWAQLDTTVRDEWNYQATLYQFLNRFGQSVNLTGRQLFVKLTFNCSVIFQPAPNPLELESFVSQITASPGTWSLASPDWDYTMEILEGPMYVATAVIKLKNDTDRVSIRKAKILAVNTITTTLTLSLRALISQQFGQLAVGQSYMVVSTPYNAFGFKGAPQSVVFNVEA